MKKKNKTQEESPEIKKLRAQLAVAEETLRAIRQGEVDALMVSTPRGDQIFTLKGAEKPYRILMEKMKEGTVTLAGDDTIFYCNQGFADMLKKPLEKMIGTKISQFIAPVDSTVFEDLLRQGRAGHTKGEVKFLAEDGVAVSTHLSVDTMLWDGLPVVYLVATDITKCKLAEEALQKAHDELEIKVKERTRELIDANDKLNVEIAERKRAEQALRESESSLVEAQRLARIGNWRWDIKTDEVHWSDEMYAIFEVDMKSFIPNINSFTDFIHADDLPSVTGVMEKLTSEGGCGSIDFRIILTDGSIRFVHAEGEIVAFDESGKPSLMIGIDQDITERKLAEDAVREREKKYRTLTENILGVIQRFDRNLRILYISPQVEEATGIPPEKFIGKTNEELGMPPELCTLWNDLFHQVEALKQPRELAFDFPSPKSFKAYLLKVVPEFAPDGTVESFLGISTDITEQRLAEQALQKAHDELEIRVRERTAELIEANKKLLAEIEERKRAEEKIREQAKLLDNAQEAIGVRDLEHNLIYWNKGAQDLYGWTAEEAIGRNADGFLYKEEPPQLIEAKRLVLEKGEWSGELTQVTKAGREVIVESHWTLIYDSKGKPKSILIVNTDVTETKMFEAHLLRAQRMESIGILAGGIAHNLNNMLTPMMMSLQMLKQKFKDEKSQKLLNILDQNCGRSADLIKQVLSFSRGIEGERVPLQVRHLIIEIEKITKETFPRNIEIRTDIPKDLFNVSGDATQLHQVIMNLCVNARDAMPDGGILNITSSNFFIDENYARMHIEAKVSSYVVIVVSDTGIGIPLRILDRIFEPFFTTKEFGKGTGLGLSTALAIVKSHGGFMNVYSEVGEGTTFRVYLPGIKTEIQNVEEQQLELPKGHGELILVAEDEDSVREVTVSTLGGYEYNVLAARDGAEAVALYAQNKDKIKVVLMDMMMPVMDGEASIRAIRKINPEAKVIVVSGLAEKDKLAKIENNRAQALLPKPYTAEKLLKTTHEVLSGKQRNCGSK